MRDPAVTALPKVLAKAAALDTASIEVLEPSTGTRICLNMVLTPSGVRWWSGLGPARPRPGAPVNANHTPHLAVQQPPGAAVSRQGPDGLRSWAGWRAPRPPHPPPGNCRAGK